VFSTPTIIEAGRNKAMEIFEYIKDFTALAILFSAAYVWMMII
jgi:hypothetical protein